MVRLLRPDHRRAARVLAAVAPHHDVVITVAPYHDIVVAVAPHDDIAVAVAPDDDVVVARRPQGVLAVRSGTCVSPDDIHRLLRAPDDRVGVPLDVGGPRCGGDVQIAALHLLDGPDDLPAPFGWRRRSRVWRRVEGKSEVDGA